MNSRLAFAAASLLAASAIVSPSFAASSYINIPGVPGVDATPGYPGAMAASTLMIAPNTLSIVKNTDAASPNLFLAVAGGTPLGTIDALFYNAAPAGTPDASLKFFNSLASAYQSNGPTTEQVAFDASNPLALYLELPGIPGESSTPGHPDIINLRSFSITGNNFTIVKLQDSVSDDLLFANATGVHFPAARLLLYNSLPPQAAPSATIEFHDLLISSSQALLDPVQPLEQHVFNFATLSQPVPEPAGMSLAILVGGVSACISRRRVR